MSVAVASIAATFFARGDLGGLPFELIAAAAGIYFAFFGHGLIYSPFLWLYALVDIATSPFRRRDDGPPSDT